MSERTLSILVKAIGAAKAAKDLQGVDRVVSNIGARAGKGLRTAGDNLMRLGTIAAGVTVAGVVTAVKAASDFEAQLNTINTVAMRTPEELDKIGASIRKIARDTGTPLEELTQGYYDLVSAGVSAASAQGVLEAANTLAIGGLATTAETIDLLTTAINSYGGDASRAAEFADKFAEAIAAGKVTASELATSFAEVGPIAANSGIEIDELAAGYARLTAQGVPAAQAATQMRSAIVGLLSPNAKLNAIQKKTGVNFAQLAKEQGLVVALERLRKEATKAGVPLVDVLGRVEGFNFAIATTGDNLADYNAELAKVGKSTGTAAKQMSERQQGLNYQIRRLKSLAIDAAITIGSKLLPKITPLAERAVAFLDTHQGDIEAFGDKIAGAFDKALSFAQRVPWGTIASGLETAASWAGKLMDVFLKLPADAQATIIALAGLNKLSGGAVAGIVGELGKGLIKGVLGMQAGVVTIQAGVVNGGGLPGVAGGAAGAVGGGLAVTGGMAAAGIGAAVAASVLATQDLLSKTTLEERRNEGGLRALQGMGSNAPTWLAGASRAQARGGLSPDDRQARNDLAKIGLQLQRQGERGGQMQTTLERAQVANERYANSTAPSIKSMDMNMSRLLGLQQSSVNRDVVWQTQLTAAINRLASIQGRPPIVNVTVPVRTVTNNQTRLNRVANRPPGRGPLID